MNKRIKKLWLKALRSGQYKQTQGTLRRKLTESKGYSYCCLGVLEDIRVQQGAADRFPSRNRVLTKACQRWAEVEENDPVIGIRQPTTLADLNDSGKSFKQIANLIEKHL